MMKNSLLYSVLGAMLGIAVSNAHADDRWLPVVLESGVRPSAELIDRLGVALASHHVTLLGGAAAARRYNETQSQMAMPLSEEEVRSLRDGLRSAMIHASLDRWGEVQSFEMRFAALTVSEQDDFLARTGLARHFLGLCTMVASKLSESASRVGAVAQIGSCLKNFPGLARREDMGEGTWNLVQKARERIGAGGLASLKVRNVSTQMRHSLFRF